MRPIIVTGGDGKFAKTLKYKNKNKKFKIFIQKRIKYFKIKIYRKCNIKI